MSYSSSSSSTMSFENIGVFHQFSELSVHVPVQQLELSSTTPIHLGRGVGEDLHKLDRKQRLESCTNWTRTRG